MRSALRFLWAATAGYRLRPWRSPYICWRIETYSGMKADEIGFLDFWRFVWTERSRLTHFLHWVTEMDKLRN